MKQSANDVNIFREKFSGNFLDLVAPRMPGRPKEIDYSATKSHLVQCIRECGAVRPGVDGVKIGGATSFSANMTLEIQLEFYNTVIPYCKTLGQNFNINLPVIADATSNESDVSILLATEASKAGADLVIIKPTYATSITHMRHMEVVKEACPDIDFIFHVSRKSTSKVFADDVINMGKKGLIRGVVYSSREDQNMMAEIMKIMYHSKVFSKTFLLGTNEDEMLMDVTRKGGRLFLSRAANLCPLITYQLSRMHEYIRNDSNSSSPEAICEEFYGLFILLKRPEMLLQILSKVQPNIFGTEPTFPAQEYALNEKEIKLVDKMIAKYRL